MSNAFRTPERPCPHCGYQLSAATSVHDVTPPKKDDVTMCLNCGELFAFTATLALRKLTPGELATFDQELLRDVGRLRKLHREMKPRMGDLRTR